MSWIKAGPPPVPVKPPKMQREDTYETLIKAGPPPLPFKPPKMQREDTYETLPPASPSGRVDQIVKTFDTKLLIYNTSSRPPSYPSESLTPPPLLPRQWVTPDCELYETDHEYVELIKEDEPVKPRPPPLPKNLCDDTETLPNSPVFPSEKFTQMVKTLEEKQLKYNSPPQSPTYCSDVSQDSTSSDFYEAMTPWCDVCKTLKLKKSPEARIIDIKAELLYKAIRLYNQLMTEQGGKLKELITELHNTADNLDKFLMGTKIAGLTGGVASVAGGLAAAGVLLSPVTAGTSLALTAVGGVVAAAGGITRVSASVTNQANAQKISKKIDKTLQDFDDICKNVLGWLKFIRDGMEFLKQHDLSVLKKSERNSKKVANIVKLVTGDASDTASLSAGMGCYLTDGKHRLKTSLESNLAKNLRIVAEDLDKGLRELLNIKDMLSEPEGDFF